MLLRSFLLQMLACKEQSENQFLCYLSEMKYCFENPVSFIVTGGVVGVDFVTIVHS